MALRRIYILACGGTIAGAADTDDELTCYRAGKLSVRELVDAVPAIRKYASVMGEQFCNIDSSNMSESLWISLAARVQEISEREDVDGIVITHGTDSLEETAYFLHLTVHTDKPVVLVGAMRPATAISADGPLNLLDAVCAAACAETGQYGVVVVMNGTICSARFVEKTDTAHADTFKSRQLGYLGLMQNGRPFWYQRPVRRHTMSSALDCTGVYALPKVAIVYAYIGMSGELITAAMANPVQGIVVAGLGHGRMPDDIADILHEAARQGIVVVRTSRTLGGTVTTVPEYDDFVSGDSLTPQKAKILLQLALLKTKEIHGIQDMFCQY